MSNLSNSSQGSATYFDEAYFERGWERGTAYANYSESAASSPIFWGLAEALRSVFRPTNALEVGCATGAIVRNMNFLGVPTHGIDISEWAVSNALHPNVRQASAAELPFSERTFDLVYSSHALEHLPQEVYQAAFREIDRVCGPNAIQFHMLPIVGTYPYDYDEATAIQNLRADPTHVLLQRMEWWLERWAELGWIHVPAAILLPNDTDNVELSSGQFCLVRRESGLVPTVLQEIKDWNIKAFRHVLLSKLEIIANRSPDVTRVTKNVEKPFQSLGPAGGEWGDLKCILSAPGNFENTKFYGIASLACENSVPLRIALISRYGGVHEKWLDIPPGQSIIEVDVDQFRVLQGDGSLKEIDSIFFGGSIENFKISAELAVRGPSVFIENMFDE